MKCRHCHGAGFAISILLHVGALAAFIANRAEPVPVQALERQVPVQLSMFQEVAAAPVLAEPEPDPQPEQRPEPPPVEPLREQPAPPPKPNPRPKAVKPKSVAAPAQPAEPAASAPVAEQAAQPRAPVAPIHNAAEEEHLRAAYLQKLAALIEANKFYPESARRRGITGVVQVSFSLHRDGSISDLNASSSHGLLRDAAIESVHRAVPLPKVPEKVACPLPVRFGMEFNLN